MIEQLKDEMASLEFVEWDRYSTGQWDEKRDYLIVYGWIEREDDDYKDYVELRTWTGTDQINFSTSSSEFTELIYEILYDDNLENHHECQRVEDDLDIPNVVSINAD